jgi:integrase
MPALAANEKAVEKARNGEPARYQIKGSPGLNLFVIGQGKAWWRLRFRPRPGAHQTLHTIGDARHISLRQAIDEALRLMSAFKLKGIAPGQQQRERNAAMDVAQIAERWLAFKERGGRRPSYIADSRRRIKRLPKSLLVRKAMDVRRLDVTTALEIVADRGEAECNAAHRLISAIFKWAFSEGITESDPTAGVKKRFSDKARVRSFSDEELVAFWRGLQSAQLDEGTRIAMGLCLLTGQRPNEIVALRHRDLSLDGLHATMTVPGTQAKNHSEHVAPLTKTSVALFRRALDIAGDDCSCVFPSPVRKNAQGERLPIDAHALTRAITRARDEKYGLLWGIADAQLYDCRKTVATWLGDAGYLNEAIGLLFNHKTARTSSVTGKHYTSSQYMKVKREMVAAWSAHLDNILQIDIQENTASNDCAPKAALAG